jgi:AraC family transcriptional regulator, regulatory protein of adaptative response / methylated-DNA-[protein]-cysteine methyltransferase
MMETFSIMRRISTSPQILFSGSLTSSNARRYGDVEFATENTSIGSILVAVSAQRVVTILIEEGNTASLTVGQLLRKFPQSKLSPQRIRSFLSDVIQFVETPVANIALPMDIHGTPFQQAVWKEVLKIPFGETTTFTEIARLIGAPKAVRAVGNACSHNPLEFAIPCHRVLRSDGSWSGGSAWGDFRQSTIVSREAEALRSQ